MTRQGRIAVLTNFREHGQGFSGLKSRGAIVNSFLTLPPDSLETTEEFAKRLVEEVGVTDVGGFSLAFGKLAPFGSKADRPGLAIVSNRSSDADDLTWLADKPGEICGLSNSHFGDLSWPKVVQGEQLMRQLINSNVQLQGGKEDLIHRLFDLLSLDTLPRQKNGEDWETYLTQLRNSIFIPQIGGEKIEKKAPDEIAAADSATQSATASTGGTYGTQKQTVILVDKQGKVTFIEKTLYDQQCQPLDDSREEHTFDIEGWGA